LIVVARHSRLEANGACFDASPVLNAALGVLKASGVDLVDVVSWLQLDVGGTGRNANSLDRVPHAVEVGIARGLSRELEAAGALAALLVLAVWALLKVHTRHHAQRALKSQSF